MTASIPAVLTEQSTPGRWWVSTVSGATYEIRIDPDRPLEVVRHRESGELQRDGQLIPGVAALRFEIGHSGTLQWWREPHERDVDVPDGLAGHGTYYAGTYRRTSMVVAIAREAGDSMDGSIWLAASSDAGELVRFVAQRTGDEGGLIVRVAELLPWISDLPETDREACVQQLIAAARDSMSEDRPELVVTEVDAWRETAELYASGIAQRILDARAGRATSVPLSELDLGADD